MTLQDLPVELFLDIVSLLPTSDKQCLRIACSAFRKLITFDFGAPLKDLHTLKFYHAPDDTAVRQAFKHRYIFICRCFKPGNIFSKTTPKLNYCGRCLRICRRRKFPMEESAFKINDSSVCEDCLVGHLRENLPAGCGIDYRSVGFFVCRVCETQGDLDDSHTRHEEDGGRYCRDCHMEICKDKDCNAWPEDFVEEHAAHF